MTTKTQTLATTLASVLTTAGLTVRTSSDDAYSFEATPVVVLDIGDEFPATVIGGAGGFVYWTLNVELVISANGATPKLAPEPTRAAAHAALYADRTLSGNAVDIVAGAVTRQIDNENPALGITRCRYEITYRIAEGST